MPPDDIIWTVYGPGAVEGEAETVRTELAVPPEDGVTTVGFSVAVSQETPLAEMVASRPVARSKPFMLATITVDELEEP